MNKRSLYLLMLLLCATGYLWVFVNEAASGGAARDAGVCLFKHVTGIPCPSCGSTRSVLSFLHGDLIASLYWNPMGFLIAAVMVIAPLWILGDWVTGRDSFYRMYAGMEAKLKMKRFALPAILLVIANWLWNIHKGL